MTLTIKIWDVLQGLAIYVNTPSGKHVVIDAGINEEGFQPIYHLCKNEGVEQIDYAIVTHPHKDHLDEIKNLVDLSPKVFTRPKHLSRDDLGEIKTEDQEIFETYFDFSDNYNLPIAYEDSPENPKNNGGVEIKTFVPSECSKDNLNNHSVVTVFTYAGSKILIPGDNESDSWKELLGRTDFKEAIKGTDILIAPHHGRESAYHQELFEHISPKLIIISDSSGTDTSANSRYSNHATGWTVHSRSGQESKKRFVLSTRQDGMIEINIGYNDQEKKKNYMAVKIK